jgi:hypothetical protein
MRMSSVRPNLPMSLSSKKSHYRVVASGDQESQVILSRVEFIGLAKDRSNGDDRLDRESAREPGSWFGADGKCGAANNLIGLEKHSQQVAIHVRMWFLCLRQSRR